MRIANQTKKSRQAIQLDSLFSLFNRRGKFMEKAFAYICASEEAACSSGTAGRFMSWDTSPSARL